MSNVIQLPERHMNPPEPPTHNFCEMCGSEVIDETWAIGTIVACGPHHLIAIAERTIDGFDKFDLPTLILMRDVLGSRLAACEAQIIKATGGKWEGSQP